jgi:hypothetical protein
MSDTSKPAEEAKPRDRGAAGPLTPAEAPKAAEKASKAAGVKMVLRDARGAVVDTVTAYKPTTVTQLRSRGYRAVEEA